jgi:hypothetical protein
MDLPRCMTTFCRALQTLAALAELLIPHFVSASIFSVANNLPASTFHHNVKMLAVSSSGASPARVSTCVKSSWLLDVAPGRLSSCDQLVLGGVQAFAFSYGVCAGVRGFLFSILSTRLMEQLRWVVHHDLVALLCGLKFESRLFLHNMKQIHVQILTILCNDGCNTTSCAAYSGQVFDALVRQPVEFFDKVESVPMVK